MQQAPLQGKTHLDPNQKAARVPSGRTGQWGIGQRGVRSLFPGDQKTGDMRAAIQTRNQQTGGGVNVRLLWSWTEEAKAAGAGSKEVLRDVRRGGGSRESFSEQGKGKSSPSPG